MRTSHKSCKPYRLSYYLIWGRTWVQKKKFANKANYPNERNKNSQRYRYLTIFVSFMNHEFILPVLYGGAELLVWDVGSASQELSHSEEGKHKGAVRQAAANLLELMEEWESGETIWLCNRPKKWHHDTQARELTIWPAKSILIARPGFLHIWTLTDIRGPL